MSDSMSNETTLAEHTDAETAPTAVSSEDSPLKEAVIAAMREIYDPEIPVNVYDLGLIYGVEIDENGRVAISMTLTSPACPVAGSLPGEIESRVVAVEGVSSAWVEIVWEPPWGPELMSEEARLTLGFF